MTGQDDQRQSTPSDQSPIPIERLTRSYRFDDELATLLTTFQYRDDSITLTSKATRPLPATAYHAETPGLEAVFEADASLVFVCYNERGHRMVNPIETTLIQAIADAVNTVATAVQPDGGQARPLDEEPADLPTPDPPAHGDESTSSERTPLSFGVVTPHNAQRGALDTTLAADTTANTVEKYQGGERDIIAVSATVSDPEFARREERFILNPRRLLVAISRSRLVTIVVCSTALFEVVPDDNERLDNGPVWARLFTQAVGRDADPAWAGPLAEFVGEHVDRYATVPVRVYPSALDVAEGDH
jgi:hypothetical protein